MLEIFSYSFMLRALICGTLICLMSSLVGTPLVLKRNSMIGDGLSHVAFASFSVATILNITPIIFAIPVTIIVSFLIIRMNDNSKINSETLIALISASSLAIGTFAISIVKGVNNDINNYLFGSILSLTTLDTIISIVLCIIVVILFIYSYNKIFALTFDETFAKSIGINTELYNAIFASISSIVIVLGMRLMGALLISSLIIFPTVIASMCSKNYMGVVIKSIIISIITFVIGLITSYYLGTPTGSTIVIINIIVFIIIKIINLMKGNK